MQEVFIMKIFHYSSYKNDIKRPTNFTEKKKPPKIQQFHQTSDIHPHLRSSRGIRFGGDII